MNIRTLIAEKFGKEIDDNDTLADLGADPLDCVELLIDIDERLGVDLPDDAVGLGTTVGEVVELVEGVARSSAGRSAGLRPEPSSSGSLGHSAAAANAEDMQPEPRGFGEWEYEPDEFDEEDEDYFDCHMRPDGQCCAAGSEDCEFECPTMRAFRRGGIA